MPSLYPVLMRHCILYITANAFLQSTWHKAIYSCQRWTQIYRKWHSLLFFPDYMNLQECHFSYEIQDPVFAASCRCPWRTNNLSLCCCTLVTSASSLSMSMKCWTKYKLFFQCLKNLYSKPKSTISFILGYVLSAEGISAYPEKWTK